MCRSCVRSMRKASGLGAQPIWISLIHRCRSNRIRNFHGICIGAVMHRGGMAVDQADILKIVCSEWTQKVWDSGMVMPACKIRPGVLTNMEKSIKIHHICISDRHWRGKVDEWRHPREEADGESFHVRVVEPASELCARDVENGSENRLPQWMTTLLSTA